MKQPWPAGAKLNAEVETELERLPATPIVQLRKRYKELFKAEPPKAYGPDLLKRSIAHRLQERAYGGLPAASQRLLNQLVRSAAAKPTGRLELPRRIKPGSELVRTWNRKTYRVTVLAGGFAYDGKTFASLSEIATLITGTKWNGPRFFGLRHPAPRTESPPMATEGPKSLRCAIYTRKSTEHGLDQEFNSLDAQREACEAYIKSQAFQGWKTLAQPYDDPAYSGGNLDRPALKRMLADIVAGKIDVVVVYKIDRLTRSLADFAKLVDAFDSQSVSFVAVTQQFNTTPSMGRLTLNVLLSFAQFERELAAERVRDKIAASRRKGKWTGGSVPLGYDAKDKKLVINKTEAETVRTIFRLYLEHGSFSRLVAELDRRRIVTKRRNTKVAKYNGGIPFTYGPLAYFLKNRIYIGETHHGGKWFKGEHPAILDRSTFDRVQDLLKSNAVKRKVKFSESGAWLQGKLFDDKGNRMGPSFCSKNGVRYRFYVSTAMRGRKHAAGAVTRISATEIEALVEAALAAKLELPKDKVLERVDTITVSTGRIRLALAPAKGRRSSSIEIPWSAKAKGSARVDAASETTVDQKLVKSIVRAHAWLSDLSSGRHTSIEALAAAADLHPKVIRQGLRLAFLPPDLTRAALAGEKTIELKQIPKLLPLSWSERTV
jgi:site-specific DNA recombinase